MLQKEHNLVILIVEEHLVGGDNLFHIAVFLVGFFFYYKDTTKKRDYQIFLHIFTKKVPSLVGRNSPQIVAVTFT